MSFTPPIAKARHSVRKMVHGPKLPFALAGAIVVALLLTGASVAWYTLGGYAKLDLSRPGYEHERTEVRASDSQKTYDTTSAITKSAIDEFLHEYDTRSKDLDGYGNFRGNALDDGNIQLSPISGGSTQ